MAVRTDIDMTYATNPRVLEVRVGSSEMLMQDYIETLRKQEDTFRGMTEARLTDAAGKEDLGDGVSVGITVSAQDLLLAFAPQTTPAISSTVDSSPVSPITSRQIMIDASVDFVAAGVVRGSLLINFTDQSIADVVAVDSATQLQTRLLTQGIGNTYDASDVYKIWNIVQCNAKGGNLVAVDDLDAVISPILPTAFTQVLLSASSSAVQVVTGSGVLPSDVVDIKDAIYNEIMEGSFDFRDFMLIMASALGGKASGMEGTDGIFRNPSDTKDRISSTFDQFGNRTSVTFDLT